MPNLRERACSQALQRAARGPNPLREAGPLRDGVHGEVDDEGRRDAGRAPSSRTEVAGRILRGMWSNGRTPRAPSRRRSDEQRAREHRNPVRFLPPEMALAERKEGATAQVLRRRRMRSVCPPARLLREALPALEALGRPAPSQAKSALAGHSRSRLERSPRIHRSRLSALGDGVVVQVAELVGRMILEHAMTPRNERNRPC